MFQVRKSLTGKADLHRQGFYRSEIGQNDWPGDVVLVIASKEVILKDTNLAYDERPNNPVSEVDELEPQPFVVGDEAFEAFIDNLEYYPLKENQCLQNLMSRPKRWI
ncbi:hypothetical protein HU751_012360 [Pseudomonas sp. BW13M1]|uniref:Uncharacterized protein n=1 Tax=Pseudomonas peradeniyensis TaxID=2745488 RepID=A0A923K3M9_9PSED|nr:hypothetical protein [Pseudomonas peradeniyensis]MBV4505638.1 hypothetical protein [Pseudomonas peradeniyensis]